MEKHNFILRSSSQRKQLINWSLHPSFLRQPENLPEQPLGRDNKALFPFIAIPDQFIMFPSLQEPAAKIAFFKIAKFLHDTAQKMTT